MNRNRLIIALIVFLIIVAIVLLRGPINAIFVPNPEKVAIKGARGEYEEALEKVEEAEAAFEKSKMAMQSDEDAYNKAIIARDEAKAKLEALGEIAEEDEGEKIRVEVMNSTSVTIASGIALSGNVEAARKLEVRAETSGQVISEPINSGASVTKGQVLCQLEPGTSQANLTQAQAALNTARTQYNSTLTLKNRGLTSTAALQSATAALEQAESAAEEAKRQVNNLTIRAPFDGVLESQTAELGTLLQPGATCASIVVLDRLLLVGYASETQVERIRMGAPATGILRDGQTLKGEVTFVSATADPTTRTYRTEVSVANSGNVRDGATARVEIALAGTKGHLLPQNVLTLNDEGVAGVKVYSDGIAAFVPVDVVRDTPEGVWVTGLPDESVVIIAGQDFVSDGELVEAVFENGDKS